MPCESIITSDLPAKESKLPGEELPDLAPAQLTRAAALRVPSRYFHDLQRSTTWNKHLATSFTRPGFPTPKYPSRRSNTLAKIEHQHPIPARSPQPSPHPTYVEHGPSPATFSFEPRALLLGLVMRRGLARNPCHVCPPLPSFNNCPCQGTFPGVQAFPSIHPSPRVRSIPC